MTVQEWGRLNTGPFYFFIPRRICHFRSTSDLDFIHFKAGSPNLASIRWLP